MAEDQTVNSKCYSVLIVHEDRKLFHLPTNVDSLRCLWIINY